MGLFQRISDELAKGYREAAVKPSPSSQGLQALRSRAVDQRDITDDVRTKKEQAAFDLEVSEIDSMIVRADKLAAEKAKRAVAI